MNITAVEIGTIIRHHTNLEHARAIIPTLDIASRKRVGTTGRTAMERLKIPPTGKGPDDRQRLVSVWPATVIERIKARPGMGNRITGESKVRAAKARWDAA